MSKLNFTQLFRILQQIRASCVQNPQSKTFCNPRTAWLDVLTTEILPSVRRNHQPATRICPACLVKWDLSRNTGFAYWPEWIPIPRGNKVFCSMGRGFIMIYHDLSNLFQFMNISEPISASENIEICLPNMAQIGRVPSSHGHSQKGPEDLHFFIRAMVINCQWYLCWVVPNLYSAGWSLHQVNLLRQSYWIPTYKSQISKLMASALCLFLH
jgi:hypothetical protein